MYGFPSGIPKSCPGATSMASMINSLYFLRKWLIFQSVTFREEEKCQI